MWEHYECLPGDPARAQQAPVIDRYPYNEGRVYRDANLVRDLFWGGRFQVRGGGKLLLSASYGDVELVAELDLDQDCVELRRGNDVIAKAAAPDLLNESHAIGVSLVDQQFLLAIDDQVVLAAPLERPASARKGMSQRFGVTVKGLYAALSDLQVFRDIYYTAPVGLRAAAGVDSQYLLADDEYYVLGDNSPDSLDSRFLSAGPAIAGKLLVGKPLVVYFPSRWWSFGSLRFQIPEITKIRYIR